MTNTYSLESKGRAERLDWTFLDMERIMLLAVTEALKALWAEAVHTGCFLPNGLVTQSCCKGCTNYEVIHGKQPDVSHIRKFGC